MRISQCVISTHCLAVKYLVNGVVGVVKGDQMITRSCYATAAKETLQITSLDTRGDSVKGRQEPVENLEEVVMKQDNPDKVVKIRSSLKQDLRIELINSLRSHADVFAWLHEDTPRIDPKITYYKLAIKKGTRLVKQKMRCFNQEKYEAINIEVEKLL